MTHHQSRNTRASILVVDDQPANLKLLRTILEQHGYKIRLLKDGRSALASAIQHPPDLVLLDVKMPEMNGYEVFEHLRADPGLAQIPVIFLSGSKEVEYKVRAFDSGAVDYITKPFQFDELLSRVETHLRTYLLLRARERRTCELEQMIRTRTRDVEESRIEVLHRLAIAAEYRDNNTGKHTQRVGHLSALLAQSLGVSSFETEVIRLSAPLHDVGKIGIPDGILLARRKLTSEEFKIMKSHVLIGSAILSGSKSALLKMAECIACYHHERWDGTGYCAGLAGEDIPLPARIVSVADAFDALTHTRPYKEAWSTEEAMAEIAGQSGQQFDPRVVNALALAVANGRVTANQPDALESPDSADPLMSASLWHLAERLEGIGPALCPDAEMSLL